MSINNPTIALIAIVLIGLIILTVIGGKSKLKELDISLWNLFRYKLKK